MPKDKTAREILTKLIPEDIRDNPYAKDMVDQALLALKELVMEKKDGYAKGLCEKIGSLLMATDGMREGFKQFKSLKEIERQRNIGYNQAVQDIAELFEVKCSKP